MKFRKTVTLFYKHSSFNNSSILETVLLLETENRRYGSDISPTLKVQNLIAAKKLFRKSYIKAVYCCASATSPLKHQCLNYIGKNFDDDNRGC